jgi:tRNA threonylcarbamoyladenosine biosynthesis protein TsaB
MVILAFDTTMAACSVAVWRDGATLAAQQQTMERGQAEALAPLIDVVMREARIAFAALTRIAVTIGPGSFTGVRVGLATARGFGLALNVPVIGATTGEVLAHGAAEQGTVVSLVDTKRGDFYMEMFDANGTRRAEPQVLSATEIGAAIAPCPQPVTVVGDGATMVALKDVTTRDRLYPDPAALAALAARREPVGGGPLPLYVRPPAVTVSGA